MSCINDGDMVAGARFASAATLYVHYQFIEFEEIQMNSAPLFSVCIPTYNRASSLPTAIDSILTQDFDNYEIVILDNASTDNTQETLNRYNDKRLRIFRNSHTVNMWANHNKCIEHAQAEWIVFLHSDDYFLPGTLLGFSKAIGSAGKFTSILMSKTASLPYTCTYSEFGGLVALNNFLRDGFSVPTGNIFSKSFFVESKIYFDPEEIFSDALFLLRAALETNARFETMPSVSKVWAWTGTSGQLFSSYGHIEAWNRLAYYLKERVAIDPSLMRFIATSMSSWRSDQITHLLFRFACIGWVDAIDRIVAHLNGGGVEFKSGRYYKHIQIIRLLGINGHRLLYSGMKISQKALIPIKTRIKHLSKMR